MVRYASWSGALGGSSLLRPGWPRSEVHGQPPFLFETHWAKARLPESSPHPNLCALWNSMNATPTRAAAQPRQENLWLNLLCNAVVPGFLLSYLSKEQRLGPVWG